MWVNVSRSHQREAKIICLLFLLAETIRVRLREVNEMNSKYHFASAKNRFVLYKLLLM